MKCLCQGIDKGEELSLEQMRAIDEKQSELEHCKAMLELFINIYSVRFNRKGVRKCVCY